MIEALAFFLAIIGAFAFGYQTGRDRARDQAAFDQARHSIAPGRFEK